MVSRNACFKAEIESTDVILTKKGRLPASNVTTLQKFDYQNCRTHKTQTKGNIVHVSIFLETALILKISKFPMLYRFQAR